MIYTYIYIALANVFDFYSTVIQQNWRGEENPVARWAWHYGGDFGLLALKAIATIVLISLLQFLVWFLSRYKTFWGIIAVLSGTFTLLIALTNMAWIDYKWMSWLQF